PRLAGTNLARSKSCGLRKREALTKKGISVAYPIPSRAGSTKTVGCARSVKTLHFGYKVVDSVPIRLTQTPARCRVRPHAGIKVGIGRRLNTARDAEQRAERVERVETPVEAERELIEVGL